MKRQLTVSVFLFCIVLFATQVSAVLLTFDDIPGVSQNSNSIFSSYGGFNFTTTVASTWWIDTVGSSWNYGSVSGDFTMLNNNGGNAIITANDGSDFTFSGVWTRIWGGGSRSVNIQGYNNGSLVWTTSYTLNATWANQGAQSGAIDELRLNLGNHFLVDNLSLNDAPEPSTFLLFGLVMAACIYRKRS